MDKTKPMTNDEALEAYKTLVKNDLMRTKIDFIFRFMYDMGAHMQKLIPVGEIQVILLTQMFSTQLKIFHITREFEKVDPAMEPNALVIEVGKIMQDTMNKLFDELEACERITTLIPIATRQAPIFERHVKDASKKIFEVYAKPVSKIIKPGDDE